MLSKVEFWVECLGEALQCNLCHTIENSGDLHGKAIVSRIFRSSCKLGQNNVAENGEAVQSIPCHGQSRGVIDDSNAIFAVPRQSFVIHPNGGWWHGSLGSIMITKFPVRIHSLKMPSYIDR
jgi:hypothetical protein